MGSLGSTYLLSRSGLANARLTFQNLSHIVRQGWYLHPVIQSSLTAAASSSSSEPVRVADLATGNAIWAIETSKTLAKAGVEAEVTGLDISPAQFPPAFTLPSNVTLDVYDLFEPAAEKYRGYFDVIHVRLIVAAIYSSDKDILLNNILSMLKPGGYLQWEELMFPPASIVRAGENGTLAVSKEITGPGSRMFRAADFSAACKWAATLPEAFGKHHLTDIIDFRPPIVAGELPSETQSITWTISEVIGHAIAATPEEEKKDILRQELEMTLKEMNELVESGAMLAHSWITAVGRRPVNGS